jgi:hypothetical protein
MANAKNSDFITRARQAAAGVLDALAKLDGIRLEWDSLYNAVITADDFEPAADKAGTNAEIDLAVLTAEMTTQAALDGLMDAGHRTNLLKVK